MQDFSFYFSLGLEHVLDWKAYDHVLFLLVLAAVYTFTSWKKLLLMVTVFTVGHTISLLLAHYDVVSVNTGLIECLIPITIAITAIANFFTKGNKVSSTWITLYIITTLFFGLIHGFGFATYYKMIAPENEVISLLGFAAGVEISQVIVVLCVLILAYLFQGLFKVRQREWVLVVSAIVIGRVLPMLAENCLL
ncbi:HupE/UreJ family protein [Patiriisocius hiemis]|uniref:HupE/UreJ family protein n=1 Tax=Patiriisocius hiemis TaxID=3075604 RepID=A0ABU2YBT6_9FLAO|nr:HupE/UreJ family protein [Constantimarinum sp. W242]MDT0555341.1 HupE/UreJ family protein [Constantimarinum sp. W242]